MPRWYRMLVGRRGEGQGGHAGFRRGGAGRCGGGARAAAAAAARARAAAGGRRPPPPAWRPAPPLAQALPGGAAVPSTVRDPPIDGVVEELGHDLRRAAQADGVALLRGLRRHAAGLWARASGAGAAGAAARPRGNSKQSRVPRGRRWLVRELAASTCCRCGGGRWGGVGRGVAGAARSRGESRRAARPQGRGNARALPSSVLPAADQGLGRARSASGFCWQRSAGGGASSRGDGAPAGGGGYGFRWGGAGTVRRRRRGDGVGLWAGMGEGRGRPQD
jgi:hypothetical protein